MIEMKEFEVQISELINKNSEGEFWDFKSKYTNSNVDFLHDIICMSNNQCNHDSYLIYGVSEVGNNLVVLGIENDQNRKRLSDVRQLLKDKKFACENRPEIAMETLVINSHEIDVIVVRKSIHTPYYLIESYKDDSKQKQIRAYHIYTRVNDTNTDIDKSADFKHVEYLWKKRFGLDLDPLERLEFLLCSHEKWFVDCDRKVEWYHKQFPEFTINLSDPKEADEPIRHFYCNQGMYFGMMTFKYYSTTLFEHEYWTVDEFRRYIPKPEIGCITIQNDCYYFYYFILNERSGKILGLLTNGTLDISSRLVGGKQILVFENRFDFESFKNFYEIHFDEVNSKTEDEHFILFDVKKESSQYFSVEHLCLSIVAYRSWKDSLIQN